MRLNKFLAQATGCSRRAADDYIADGRVLVNGQPTTPGVSVSSADSVSLDGRVVSLPDTFSTIMLNKPAGYVVSRNGQGSRTVYDLLPNELHALKPIGRLDKDSSGLLLMTNDGILANELTHPSYQKMKRYELELDASLAPLHHQMIHDVGIELEDGSSRLGLERLHEGNDNVWLVSMHEGRNRQIRRTFNALGYRVVRLHRISFGDYHLGALGSGSFSQLHKHDS